MSAAAVDEIDNLQQYVYLLAQHDLAWNNAEAPFAEAAFDLLSTVRDLAQRGMQNLTAFLSPPQQHAHALLPQAPLFWGTWLQRSLAALYTDTAETCTALAEPTVPAQAGFTIWLTTPLRGGVKRNRRAGGGDDIPYPYPSRPAG